MAKRPDERYQSAADMLADFRTLRRQMESGGSGVSDSRAPRSWQARTAPALILGLAIAASAFLAWRWRPSAGLPVGTSKQITGLAGWEADPAISPDGTLVAYASDESGNADIWIIESSGGSALRLTDDPSADRRPTWYPDGSALAFVSTRSGRPGVWKVPRLGGDATLVVDNADSPSISPDGSRLAFLRAGPSGQRRVFVAALRDPSAATLLSQDDHGLWDHADPTWSPDGHRICYAAARDLWIVPAAGGAATRLTTDGEVDFEPAWSPDGNHVYFSSYREGTLALWRVEPGGRPIRVTMGTGPERHPSVSMNGASVAYTTFGEDPDVVVRDLATGEEQIIRSGRDEHAPVLAPDASAVAFISDRIGGRFDLWIQPLERGRLSGPPRRLTDHEGSVAQPAFSPDGRWIAYHRVVGNQRDVWIVPRAGGMPVRLTDDPAVDIHPEWSPDGSQIAFISERSGASHVWTTPVVDGHPAGVPRQLTFGSTDDEAPVWSPDGTSIAFVGNAASGQTDAWIQSAGGGPARRLTTGAGVGRVRWSRTSPDLLVCGLWGSDTWRIRRVSLETGAFLPFDTRGELGMNGLLIHFDISRDEHLLVFARARQRGDIWMLGAAAGSY